MDEKVVLHGIEGIARLSGYDEYDNQWVQFMVDELAGEEPGQCEICHLELWSGWMCLDGGEEVCAEHVIY